MYCVLVGTRTSPVGFPSTRTVRSPQLLQARAENAKRHINDESTFDVRKLKAGRGKRLTLERAVKA